MPHPPINAHTRLLAVLGDPIHHSLSPRLHNLAITLLAQQGTPLNYRYLAFQVHPGDLPRAVAGLRALHAIGFNATIPHKEALLPLMDHLTDEARQVGAVNTVLIDDNGQCTGHNTDIYGFATAALEAFGPQNNGSALLLGAGGAARAVLAGLPRLGIRRITVVNRNLSRAEALLESIGPHLPAIQLVAVPWEQAPALLESCQLVVNTTSVGLHGDSPEMAAFRHALPKLDKSANLMDIVYARQPTLLLQEAARLGLATADGLAMLVHQGAAAFQLWTGREMPVQTIMARLRESYQPRQG